MFYLRNKEMTESKRIAVVGAGISGLSTAYWLQKHGYSVTVLEKTSHIGGSIITENADGFLIDLGPNSGLETSEVLKDLIDEIGLQDQKIYANEASNNRYVVRDSLLHAIPMSAGKFLKTKLFSTRAKIRLFKEPFIKPTDVEDISLADFVRYRLGDEFLDYAINPFVAGVYAGDPEVLSTPAAFPKLYALEQKYGSFIKGTIKGARERKKRKEVSKDRAKMFTFLDGMQTFTDRLAEKLEERIQIGTPVVQLTPGETGWRIWTESGDTHEFDAVVLSVPSRELFQLLEPIVNDRVAPLETVPYPPVAVVFMGFKDEVVERDLDGFGFLVPKVENKQILGSIWSSTIFPNRAPEGFVAFTTFVGGTRQPDLANLDDEALTKIVIEDLNDLVGIRAEPAFVRIKRWPRAIPQYVMGYPKIQQLFTELEEEYPGLYFAGNFRRGIGIGDSVLSAHETVTKMID